jgi:hypothetical protein
VLKHAKVNHTKVAVPSGRGDASALWGDVLISRQNGVSAYFGGSGLQVRNTCPSSPGRRQTAIYRVQGGSWPLANLTLLPFDPALKLISERRRALRLGFYSFFALSSALR